MAILVHGVSRRFELHIGGGGGGGEGGRKGVAPPPTRRANLIPFPPSTFEQSPCKCYIHIAPGPVAQTVYIRLEGASDGGREGGRRKAEGRKEGNNRRLLMMCRTQPVTRRRAPLRRRSQSQVPNPRCLRRGGSGARCWHENCKSEIRKAAVEARRRGIPRCPRRVSEYL